jgi:hypothetical protein
MKSVPIKKTNKKSRKKERRKRGKTMEEGRKNLICFTHLELQGIFLLLSPPQVSRKLLLHKLLLKFKAPWQKQ